MLLGLVRLAVMGLKSAEQPIQVPPKKISPLKSIGVFDWLTLQIHVRFASSVHSLVSKENLVPTGT
jgi:hypothetical protein